ncbi:anti-sigma factor [Enemella evansiae]|uniref:anti-sigma factor n=1 Tax=Enemella evansiae TaxID=2016499 RepID=UPI000B9640C0|nr:anti-sigma factor [Enemella evansiae]OYO01551.1 anti-sigma factor [Enemella evansiae]
MTDERIPADLHGLLGGYLLDALTDVERQQFERHLASCPDCRAEVGELRESLAEVSRVTATAPPPALREQVLARAREIRPLPPNEPVRVTARRSPWGWRVVAAAAALVAVIAGGWAINQQLDARQQAGVRAAEAQREADLLTAPDAVVRPVQLPDGGRGSVVVSRSRGQAMFLAGSMSAPPTGRAYQLWLMKDGTPVPDATFDADGRIWLRGDPNGAAAVAITMEPAGGSQTPTMPVLAAIPL